MTGDDESVAGRSGLGGHGDSAVAVAIGVVVCSAYFLLGLRLAHGDYFQANNFAFDYDAATYVRSFFGDGGAFILRHPFVGALRPLCRAALALGIPLPAAISGFFAAIGALTVSVAYLCFADLRIGLPERLLLAAFFALSSCQVINGIVADSFGLSGLGLAVLYFLFLKRVNDPSRAPVARYGVAVYLFGITVSNLVQPVIAEVVLWFGCLSPQAFVRRLFVSGLILGVLLLAGMLLFVPWGTLPPLELVRHYYWESQFHGAEMVGLWTILKSFVAYTFVAPEFTMVPLPNGEPGMLDFRDFRMSGTGLWALGLWLALLASGMACAVLDRQQRRLAAFLGLVVGINLVIHHYVQFRLSVYLYGSHVQLAILLLAALALRMSSRHGGPVRVMGLTGMAGLALLTALNNIPRFLELVSAFG